SHASIEARPPSRTSGLQHPEPGRGPPTTSGSQTASRLGWSLSMSRSGHFQMSSVVPFGTPAHAGKSGCGRPPRSVPLGAAEPVNEFDPGADGGAAHCCHEHEGPRLFHPYSVPAGDRAHVIDCAGRISRMEEIDDTDLVVERVAALDLGKAGLDACVRVPHTHHPGRRMQELRSYGTTTAQLLELAAWLRHWHVQRVVMESTSTYWKGVYYLLEAEGFDCWLVNAREVKNVPGRAKWPSAACAGPR